MGNGVQHKEICCCRIRKEREKKCKYILLEETISKKTEKYLGVTITDNITPDKHINNIMDET